MANETQQSNPTFQFCFREEQLIAEQDWLAKLLKGKEKPTKRTEDYTTWQCQIGCDLLTYAER